MKKLLVFLMALVLSIAPALSQKNDEKLVAEAVEKLRQAILDGSEKALSDITADDLSYGHSSGKVEDKKTFISRLVNGDSDFKTLDLSDQTIKVVGNTAIVRHKLVAEVVDGGKPGNPNLSVLLIWQKQNGQWKLLARQAVKNR